MLQQWAWLVTLGLPTACVTWTITHEEIFREPREWLLERSRICVRWWQRKICYAFTCEYCFSHYVAAAAIAIADFQLLMTGWRGYLTSWLALVAVTNVYMSAFGRLRVEIHKEQSEIKETDAATESYNRGLRNTPNRPSNPP